MKTDFDIDFVIPWVDGSDPEWIKLFNQYAPESKRKDVDASVERYRDYGTLKYWFRGVEKFAPWVRKVHFITNGQKPDWLNLDCPKLHWVKHEDYIPKEYLPVFSSHPIELCMHRIDGLAEHFVYFNDDLFLTNRVTPETFFRNGLPCDSAIMNALSVGVTCHIDINNLKILNDAFDKKSVIKQNLSKWLNLKYGRNLLQSLCILPWPHFTGFICPHMALSYSKQTLEEVWEKYPEELSDTMSHKFRSFGDVNQYIFRYWNLCKGEFYPISPFRGRKLFGLRDAGKNGEILEAIERQKCYEIVINDEEINNPEQAMTELCNSFDKILGEKSMFEK